MSKIYLCGPINGCTRGKFVVIVADHGARISPWLRYHSHAIVGSFAAAFKFIESVVQA